MVKLRHFNDDDAAFLRQSRYAGSSAESIREMIKKWNTLEYQNRYFEMFAIICGDKTVGTISLYQHSDSVVSIGPEVFLEFQRRGFGKKAMLAAMDIAKGKGYKIVSQQVKSDNVPSIALHKSLGFETDGYGYINKKGEEVYIFYKALF